MGHVREFLGVHDIEESCFQSLGSALGPLQSSKNAHGNSAPRLPVRRQTDVCRI